MNEPERWHLKKEIQLCQDFSVRNVEDLVDKDTFLQNNIRIADIIVRVQPIVIIGLIRLFCYFGCNWHITVFYSIIMLN